MKQCEQNLRWTGRTLCDAARGAVFFNWSCSGFTVRFRGTRLAMDAIAFAERYPGEADSLPHLAVFADAESNAYRRLSLPEGESTTILFEGESTQEHTLRVVRLSEGSKGRAGLLALRIDGELLAPPPEPTGRKIEFVGDSITCGFGNEMPPEAAQFLSRQENGLLSYAAIASDLLGAAFQCVCVSGIPLCWARDEHYRIVLPWAPEFETSARTMEGYYEYADRFEEEAEGKKEGFTRWDFSRFVPDAVVINLGTNDAFRICVSGNDPAETAHFQQRYAAFLEQVRRLNGKKPWIVCTLGSMDYFLYDNIEKAAALYRETSGDERVACFKFGAIDPWGEGMGGLGHPNVKTQERMGRELAVFLKNRI
ncbi:MAG: GDSL-type esterase/lipase family protein [Eubacteriales bacterium]|nr:GDSL-type esterase/lipase family protein [Eubacteriales bacterium]